MSETKNVNESANDVKEALNSSNEVNKLAELEEIIGGGSSEQNIPYSRFKEVISERNSLRDQMNALQKDYEKKLNEEILKIKAQKFFSGNEDKAEEDLFVEEVNEPRMDKATSQLLKEFESLRSELSEIKKEKSEERLLSEIGKARKSFEFMNEHQVLAWKKLHPNYDIEQLAELSHNQNKKFITEKYQSYLDKKKKEADISISGPELIRTIKEKAEIKDNKAASEAMKKFLGIE
jgi:hypothetical protein